MNLKTFACFCATVAGLFWGILASRATTYTVTNLSDNGAGTLRAIISGSVNSGDTVKFATNLSGKTITFTSGELLLDQTVTIDASALPGGITIDGNGSSRIFEVLNNVTAVLNSLSLTNGHATNGGGILSAGTLLARQCTIAGCSVTSNGAGGAIYNNLGTLILNQCTIANNAATIGSGSGGGIFNFANIANATLNQCTVSGNAAATGGGIDNTGLSTNGLVLFNSIVAGNTAYNVSDIAGVSPVLQGSNLVGVTPLLSPLGNNGGPTPTMLPLAGSPAIDSGSDTATNSPYNFLTDQRGCPRLSGAHVDLGAAELQAPLVTNLADSGPGSLRAAVGGYVDTNAYVSFATNLSGQTITLTTGELLLTNSFTVDGSALPGGITLSGNNSSRVFNVENNASTTLTGLTITQGSTPDAGGSVYSAAGTALHIARCTFTGSTGLEGGAVLNDGTLLMENSTLTGNNAGYGGALQCRNLTTLTHCTIVSNYASQGGGGVFNKYSTLTLNDCIISGNAPVMAGCDLFSQLAALVYTNANLIQSTFEDRDTATAIGPAPLTNAPLLAVLGNYGGSTQTMPPQLGSPAVDAGGITPLLTDQRGFPRMIGSAEDLGAAEFFLTNGVVTTNSDQGVGSLRYLVNHVLPGAAIGITFAAGLSGQTILLTNGQMVLNQNFTIDASALAQGVQINGNHASRIFYVDTNGLVILKSLGMTNGYNVGSASVFETQGGGIYNAGTLTLNQCVLSGCTVVGGDDGFNDAGNDASGGGIFNSGILTLNQCTVFSNTALGGNGGIITNTGAGGHGGIASGGGISCETMTGSLTLNQSILSGNLAVGGNGGNGGGSSSHGDNGGPGGNAEGGGFYFVNTVGQTSIVTVNQCSFTGNSATGGRGGQSGSAGFMNAYPAGGYGGTALGGAIDCGFANLSVSQSTLSGNTAAGGAGGVGTNGGGGADGFGGAIYSVTTLVLSETTVASNVASGGAGGAGRIMSGATGGAGGNSWGGGVEIDYAASPTLINQSTITGNAATGSSGGSGTIPGVAGAGQGGGVLIYSSFTLALFNSILAGNSAASNSDFSGVLTPSGTNLIGTPPVLSPLGNYGGLTQTMPPLAGSPALDTGSDSATNAPYNFATDQRGLPRRSGAHVDIGAAEAQIATTRPLLKSVSDPRGGPFQFSFTNLIGGSFSVLTSTNANLPLNQWSNINTLAEIPPGSGQFQFMDSQATNYPRRFYRVRSP